MSTVTRKNKTVKRKEFYLFFFLIFNDSNKFKKRSEVNQRKYRIGFYSDLCR